MTRRVIVIGANAAGVEAASAARKKDRTAEITLITQEKNAGYSRCGLPFVIGGHIAQKMLGRRIGRITRVIQAQVVGM